MPIPINGPPPAAAGPGAAAFAQLAAAVRAFEAARRAPTPRDSPETAAHAFKQLARGTLQGLRAQRRAEAPLRRPLRGVAARHAASALALCALYRRRAAELSAGLAVASDAA